MAFRAKGLATGAVLALGLAACQTTMLPGRRAPLIAAEPACSDFQITIYFDSDSSRLTPEAKAVVNAAARRARGCRVSAIDVVGLSDSPGVASANLALSAARAKTVTRALSRRGLPPLTFGVVAAGAAGAETTAGQERPLRRRVDVAFHVTRALAKSQ
ncbi:MAG TPA: OmpA family protein [Caulobacteraceae bacterium]|nr:OmpA family protein [Caulobacteraceae bacterium]